ncbi:MAG: penicillin-binding transpeptidase domain-containing protein, partial [Verrucomicrobiota bacterium]
PGFRETPAANRARRSLFHPACGLMVGMKSGMSSAGYWARVGFAVAVIVFVSPDRLRAEDFSSVFSDRKLTLVIADSKKDTVHVYNPDRAEKRLTAFSTFKVAHSLIALDSGAIPDKGFVIPYNEKKYPEYAGGGPGGAWGRDQDLAGALKHSVVWYYREVSARVGESNYRRYLKAFDYGNQDLSGGLDGFWLNSLEISALELVAFLRKFHRDDLPLKKGVGAEVKEMMFLEEGDDYRLFGKTGTGPKAKDGTRLGWLAGFVETKENVFVYAFNVRADASDWKAFQANRRRILRDGFARLGVTLKWK